MRPPWARHARMVKVNHRQDKCPFICISHTTHKTPTAIYIPIVYYIHMYIYVYIYYIIFDIYLCYIMCQYREANTWNTFIVNWFIANQPAGGCLRTPLRRCLRTPWDDILAHRATAYQSGARKMLSNTRSSEQQLRSNRYLKSCGLEMWSDINKQNVQNVLNIYKVNIF